MNQNREAYVDQNKIDYLTVLHVLIQKGQFEQFAQMNALAAWTQTVLFEFVRLGALETVLNYIQEVLFAFANENQHFGVDFFFRFLFLLLFFEAFLFLAKNQPNRSNF
jgi:hypothetical protein